jgi:DNA-binding transcriptional LysR family regulator
MPAPSVQRASTVDHCKSDTSLLHRMEPLALSLLPTLDALLQEASVTRAARRVGLSTPAMSHALARMREKLKDPILVRSGRGMALTPWAEQLRPRVHDLVSQARSVLDPPRPFVAKELSRSFVVLASDYVVCMLGVAVDRILQAEAPGVVLRFRPNTPDDASALRDGTADLAVGIYDALPQELKTRQLLTDRLVVVVRAGHPGVGQRLTLEQFVRLPHLQVAPRGAPGGYLDSVLEERGVARHVARAIPYFLPTLYLASRSDYLLVVSERIARELGATLGLRIVAPPVPLDPYALSLVWHPRFDADPAHRFLRDVFKRGAGEKAGDAHEGARTRLVAARKRRRKRAP